MKSKEQKRIEATERQVAYNKLTRNEKISQALSRPGHSKKELDKLTKSA